MVALNLSKIHFRPYLEGEEPTTFGSGDYTSPNTFMDLSTIRFRAWENPGSTALGGFDPDEGGGGVDPDPGGEQGVYSMYINHPVTSANEYAYYNFSPQTSIYLYAKVYLPQSWITSFIAGTGNFTSEFLEISSDNDPTFVWQGAFFTARNSANLEDGNMYLWDYYTDSGEKQAISGDSWHEIEIGYRVNGGTWESSFKLDGVEAFWTDSNTDFPGDVDAMTTIIVGSQYGSGKPEIWYIDDVKLAFDDWVSDGGTVVFTGDFETGDFSEWTGTVGSPGVDTPPV